MSAFTDSLRKVARDQNSEQDELMVLEAAARIDKLEREAAARSWAGEVDRQGGSFAQEELDARETW